MKVSSGNPGYSDAILSLKHLELASDRSRRNLGTRTPLALHPTQNISRFAGSLVHLLSVRNTNAVHGRYATSNPNVDLASLNVAVPIQRGSKRLNFLYRNRLSRVDTCIMDRFFSFSLVYAECAREENGSHVGTRPADAERNEAGEYFCRDGFHLMVVRRSKAQSVPVFRLFV